MRNYILTAFALTILSSFLAPAPVFALACYTNTGSLVITSSGVCPLNTSTTRPPTTADQNTSPTQSTAPAPVINTSMDKFGNPILTPQLPAPAPIDPTVSPSAPDIPLDRRTWDQLTPAEQQSRDAANCAALGIPPSECNPGSSQTAAKSSGLVQCGNPGQPACTLCSFLELVKTLINFIMGLAFAFVGLFITWGAFVTMTAGGSEERVKEGRKILTTAIIGLVIMLSSWMILGTVIQILTGSPSKLPWTEIKCVVPALSAGSAPDNSNISARA